MKKIICAVSAAMLVMILSFQSFAMVLPEKNVRNENLYIEADENYLEDYINDEEYVLDTDDDIEIFMDDGEYKKLVVLPCVYLFVAALVIVAISVSVKIINKKRS